MATAVTGAVAGAHAPARRRASFRRFIRRNPTLFAGGVILSLIALLAVAAPLVAGDALTMRPAERLRVPSAVNWLGTDNLGRDVYSRTVYGARVSLFVGLSVAAFSVVLGLAIGLLRAISAASTPSSCGSWTGSCRSRRSCSPSRSWR